MHVAGTRFEGFQEDFVHQLYHGRFLSHLGEFRAVRLDVFQQLDLIFFDDLGDQPFVVERGSRVAQMVVAPYARVAWEASDDLEASARGAGGFGSTGLESAGAGSGG